MRVAYVLIALLVLSPAALIATTSIFVLRSDTYGPETSRGSGEVMHFYRVRIGRVSVPVHPRRWAAAYVLVGSLLWIVGIVFLFFVWT